MTGRGQEHSGARVSRTPAAARIAWATAAVAIALAVAYTVVGIVNADTRVPKALPPGVLWEPNAVIFAAIMVGLAIGGGLIAANRPRNPLGWLLLTIATMWMLLTSGETYLVQALYGDPGSLPAPEYAAWFAGWIWVAALGLMPFVFLLFPDGRLPSPWWLWLVPAVAVGGGAALTAIVFALTPGPILAYPAVENPLGVAGLAGGLPEPLAGWSEFWLDNFKYLLGAVVLSLAIRLPQAPALERQQIRVMLIAGALITAGIFVSDEIEAGGGSEIAIQLTRFGPLLAAPLAIGAAIFRYRLYEIDVVINKGLVYAFLAAFVTAAYVVVVVIVGGEIGAGTRSPVLAVVATALVAVSFAPVRAGAQRLVNRLIYGERATPYEVLSQFAERIGSAVSVDELLDSMAAAAGRAAGAARADVWLRRDSRLEPAAGWPEAPERRAALPLDGERAGPVPDASAAYEIRDEGALLGLLTVVKAPGERLTPTENALLSDLASQAGVVLRNVVLVRELDASRLRIVEAGDAERKRVERNLHDGAQQRLISCALRLQLLDEQLDADGELRDLVEQTETELSAALEELRELGRGLHPPVLTSEGLGAAVEDLSLQAAVPVTTSIPRQRFSEPVEATAYFVVAEALTNISRYSEARAAHVSIEGANGELVVEVSDDGVGGADPEAGSGLRGLADRVAALGGSLHVASPPGDGTRILARLPSGQIQG